MAAALLQRGRVVKLLGSCWRYIEYPILTSNNRTIMTSRARLEKAVEEIQKNPYFDKYAQKIAKLQQTSPEEFLKRIDEQKRKEKEQKVLFTSSKLKQKPQSWCVTSHLWRSNVIQNPKMVRAYSQVSNPNKYITTPIFYVNADPHIGHLYTASIADAIARFNLLQGNNVTFTTGTDEHGNKVLKAADHFDLNIDEYCKFISHKFRDMCDTFDISYSNFIRTTDHHHQKAVQKFWTVLEEKGHIYPGGYTGWYCTAEESYLTEKDLVEKKTETGEIIKVSAETGHPVEWSVEENYKFKLSNFEDDLKHWLKDVKVVQPTNFHKVLTHWIEEGGCSNDLSISRPAARSPWGVPVPTDASQTVYVWLDALVNYLSALGYPDESYKKFWPPTVQVIGKDILKFHGIYWPAFLMAAGLEPPKTILCHSHWTVNDEKMSKSKGNVVSPFAAGKLFTDEGLRYFLLRDSVPQNDSNYSLERVQNILNSELADTLGNLVSRCTGKVVNPNGEIPSVSVYGKTLKSEQAEKLRKNIESLGDSAKQQYESFMIHHAADVVLETLRSANQMVEYHKPWQLAKESDNESSSEELKAVIALAMEAVRVGAIALQPVVPKLSGKLLDSLRVPNHARKWKDTKPKYLSGESKSESEKFKSKSGILFPKVKVAA
ncbi:methionine--tRNA ligase, mitochondrial-like [Trichogramma pretiosum]|uniref:methionine--tRNA ligase, mitochondrial-like n=1 Tax=Trichogramma pretiosum TaxID=7493 RepID=UPI0006C9DD47|nr:methionine--tRNA ligase, mitochondrial-like [Trichogramma pretiosum]